MSNCIFCNVLPKRIVHEYKHFYVIRDAFPVTPQQSLIITKSHVISYFQCSKAKLEEIPIILDTQKTELKYLNKKITGYNIRSNIGNNTSQYKINCNIHIIPRK